MQKPNFPAEIKDKQGNVYIVNVVSNSEYIFSAFISFNRLSVGRINWVIEDNNVMTLADLIIFDRRFRRPLWARLLPFLKWKPLNFRQRGLGSAMLHYVIAQAEALNVDAIFGFVTSDDLRETPYLLKFYEKQGFTVHRTSQGSQENSITIYYEMRSTPQILCEVEA
ncbi:MAG: GNAT family N-acetyltransferase [Nostocaceae cyanobacterium]|nr:GNAT family N-acetyltransferase [Nostocaceae cyanobacterium]